MPVIAERIVQGAAIEAEVLGLGLAHGVQQLEAGDVCVALGGDQRDLRVQQFLLGVEDIEHGAGADALLGARAFERELVGLDGDGVGLDRLLRGVIGREGRTGRGDDGALGPDDLLQGLPLERLRLAGAGRGRPPWKIGMRALRPAVVWLPVLGFDWPVKGSVPAPPMELT